MKEHIRRYHTNSYYELQCEYCVYQCGVRHQLHCMYMLYDTVTKYSTNHIGGEKFHMNLTSISGHLF
jgi:hypothetical protein